MDVFDDLAAEQDRLETILDVLDHDDWVSSSGAPGWSVADVVLHLAQTEEAVVASISAADGGHGLDRAGGRSVEAAAQEWERAERAEPAHVFRRWRMARNVALPALRRADPNQSLPWAAQQLKPRTLAATRLAEHWAHALDVTGPLGIPLPDTDRLWHVAWLAHRTLPYAFAIENQPSHEVFCELTGPSGQVWQLGSPTAASSVTGPLGDFCRVGARRLAPEQSALVPRGPHGVAALRVLRNYVA